MENRAPKFDTLSRVRISAIIASLVASLVFLFGSDAFGRFHASLASADGVSYSDHGPVLAKGGVESRYLSVSDQSARPKLRPWASGDSFLKPDINPFWLCRPSTLLPPATAATVLFDASRPYWSRAPPAVQRTT